MYCTCTCISFFLPSVDEDDNGHGRVGLTVGDDQVGPVVGIVCGAFGFYVGVVSASASNLYWLLPLVAGGCGLHVQHAIFCIWWNVYRVCCSSSCVPPPHSTLYTSLFCNMHSWFPIPPLQGCLALWLC